MKHLTLFLAAAVAAAPLVGAAAQDGSVTTYARPQGVPVRATTNFDASLRCMDELLSRSDYSRGIPINALGLDEGGLASGAHTRDMIVSALARMSEKSRFFSISIDPSEETLASLPATTLIVAGSITAFERDVAGKSKGVGVNVGPVGFGFQNQTGESILSLTLYLQDGKGVVLPMTMQSVSMALKSRNKGGDISGSVGIAGGFLQMGFSGGDGPLQAIRALIDLSLIQAVGALAQVPYQRCLSLSQTDPAGIRDARRAFDRMKPAQRISLIAAALTARGLYRGADTAVLTPGLRQAIAEYQAQQQLPSLGLPTFEVYFSLYSQQYGAPSAPATPAIAAADNRNPLGIRVAPSGPYFKASSAGSAVIGKDYRASFAVTAARPANVACFYIDAARRTTKIFPNAQRPSARIRPGETLMLPGPNDIFQIIPEIDSVREYVACFSSAEPVERFVPLELRPNFAPGASPLPAADVEDLTARMQEGAPPDLSSHVLPFTMYCINPQNNKFRACPRP